MTMTHAQARQILAREAQPLRPGVWRVDSATEPGVWWTVYHRGHSLLCTCPAALHGRACWHTLAVRCRLGEQASAVLRRWAPAQVAA